MKGGLLRLAQRLAVRQREVVEAVRLGTEALALSAEESRTAVAAELGAEVGKGLVKAPDLRNWVDRVVAAAEEDG